MNRLLIAAAALLSAATATGANAANEPLDLRQTYSGVSSVDVAHIFTYNTYANGPGATNSFAFDAGAFSFSDPFLKSSANPPINTYFLGVSPDDPGEVAARALAVAPAQHLVLAVGSAFAAGIVSGGQDFDTVFSGYHETSLISDLEQIDTADLAKDDPGYAAQQAAKNSAYDELFSFSGSLNDRLGTTPAFGGPLTLVSFSSGTTVGTGNSIVTPTGSPVPEPATWAMMIAGFGLVGGIMRTGRRSDDRFTRRVRAGAA